MSAPLPMEVLSALAAFTTCEVANAVELFGVRLRNEGFSDASLTCRFPALPPMVGYAVTLRTRTASPPTRGGVYFEKTDWWEQVAALPGPRIAVIEDLDARHGTGAFVGEVHAGLLGALGVVGVATNGSVRDLSVIEPTGFHLFSATVSVSHAYAHVVDLGQPVRVGGLTIENGDLLHGDRHGLLAIPLDIAASLPAMAEGLKERRQRIVAYSRSPEFSIEGMRRLIREVEAESAEAA